MDLRPHAPRSPSHARVVVNARGRREPVLDSFRVDLPPNTASANEGDLLLRIDADGIKVAAKVKDDAAVSARRLRERERASFQKQH